MKYIRGGSWRCRLDCRSAYRFRFSPTYRFLDIGLRVVCTKKERWFDSVMQYLRGGSWGVNAMVGRSAYRGRFSPAYCYFDFGLRAISSKPLGSLVYIPAGRFTMGSPMNETGRCDNEEQREVVIDQPFWMMDAPVTRSLYHEVMGREFDGQNPDHPMVKISWYDSIEFCRKLSKQTGHEFTLPTEAQWEYACRAGTTTAYSFGNDPKMLADYGWYYGNCTSLQPVKQKKPNPWGLYDMHGLVWEWCLDGPES